MGGLGCCKIATCEVWEKRINQRGRGKFLQNFMHARSPASARPTGRETIFDRISTYMKLYFRFAIIYKIYNNVGERVARNKYTIMIATKESGQGWLDDGPT